MRTVLLALSLFGSERDSAAGAISSAPKDIDWSTSSWSSASCCRLLFENLRRIPYAVIPRITSATFCSGLRYSSGASSFPSIAYQLNMENASYSNRQGSLEVLLYP
jgi:hypothetical protein